MHIFYAICIGLVVGFGLGFAFGSRIKAAMVDELNALRASAAAAIKPKG
jgi:hypothetical protein